MKKGANAWIFPDDMPVPKRMEIAKKAGFDGFELLFEKEGFVGLTTADQQLKDIKKMADDLNLELPSILGIHYGDASLSSSDPDCSGAFIERFKRMLSAAAILGVDTALLVPGRVDMAKTNPDFSYDRAYDNASKNLLELVDAARNAGVRVGVENVWNKFLLSPLEFRAFIDQADSEWIGAYFDVGNIIPYGFPEQWIRILASRIYKVHIKDFRVAVGNWAGFVDLLAGDVDFAEVMAALREIGYDDYLTAEVSAYKGSSEAMAYQASQAMDFILNM